MKIFLKKSQVVSEEKSESYRKQYKHHTSWSGKVMGTSTHATQHFQENFTMYRYACYVTNNDATELCITKGQEGQLLVGNLVLASWKISTWHTFVHLKNPPHTVKFDGLPENVVPIAKCLKPLNVLWNQIKSGWWSVSNVVCFQISPWQIMHHKARHDHTTCGSATL